MTDVFEAGLDGIIVIRASRPGGVGMKNLAMGRMLVHTFAASWLGLLATPAFGQLSYVGSSTIGENIMPEAARAFREKTGIAVDVVSIRRQRRRRRKARRYPRSPGRGLAEIDCGLDRQSPRRGPRVIPADRLM